VSEGPSLPGNRRRPSAEPPPAERPSASPRRPIGARVRAAAAHIGARLRGPATKVGKAALVVLAVAGAVALYRVVDRWVRTAPEFAITEITVEGEARIEPAELLAIADVAVGDNVFSRSPEAIRLALLDHPWIADATVARRLPGTLRITVREHEPAALLVVGDIYLVSDDGIVIKPAEAGDPTDLPVITGVDRGRFVRDLGYRTQLLTTVVALISEYRTAGLGARAELGEIHVEPTDELTIFVGDEAMEVRLGEGPYRRKLERLSRVLDELRREEARAAYVFLDNVRRPDRVTVRLR
jgi:cell division protein FtsQ